MHYTGNIIRPPHEAKNVLLQVTVGCSYNRCTFCNIYQDSPFRASPMGEIEEDLAEVRLQYPHCPRVFLLNGDAFVLGHPKLMEIAGRIRAYLPACRIISMYAGIMNIRDKTVEQLRELRAAGMTKLTIGVETGDDDVLARVRKGYSARDVVEQCGKLDEAGMEYSIIYLGALAGRGGGEKNARESAKTFNQINPTHIGATSLTLLPGSELHGDAAAGRFAEAGELERARNHVSNNVVVKGRLPDDREHMAALLRDYIDSYDESAMRRRRDNLLSL